MYYCIGVPIFYSMSYRTKAASEQWASVASSRDMKIKKQISQIYYSLSGCPSSYLAPYIMKSLRRVKID